MIQARVGGGRARVIALREKAESCHSQSVTQAVLPDVQTQFFNSLTGGSSGLGENMRKLMLFPCNTHAVLDRGQPAGSHNRFLLRLHRAPGKKKNS
jgi:hypothetical protein